jgi:hypothetical protein
MAGTKLKTAAMGVAALLVAAGTVLIVAPGISKRFSRHQTLADGSTLTLTHVELGTRFNYSYKSRSTRVDRWLRSVLPDSFVNKLRLHPFSGEFGFPAFDGATNLFLVTLQEARSLQSGTVVGRVQVVADDGSIFDGSFIGAVAGGSQSDLIAWRLYAFPRRSRELTLRFFYATPASTWVKAAEMVIPNPACGSYPSWSPEPIPATRTNGDLVVTLTAFEAGAPQQDIANFLSPSWKGLPGTRATFAIRQTGKAVAPWQVRSLLLSDATGNRWRPGDLVSRIEPGPEPRLSASMLGALWASELAWKLRVELSRTNDFAPEELLTMPSIPVPEPGEVLPLKQSHEINGMAVDVAFIAGADAELPPPYAWYRRHGQMNFALSVMKEVDDKRWDIVRVQDDRGRPVPFDESSYYRDYTDRVFGLMPAPDARSLTVTLAVHPSRFVEFLAKPKQVAPMATK